MVNKKQLERHPGKYWSHKISFCTFPIL